ncbi:MULTISPECIES: nucleotidyltransferase domain-containing protein [unclassified Streptomyces]|uniref:nucleotidyltransferase domain-containing protein n=1 Tax=unclassified Streptomyces TaxID=2593676 RepID=UPI002E22177D|nr:nucleotidyltransferase domain-containing protein [Streptomyces sp. NBC_01023]
MQIDIGQILETLRGRQLVPDTCQAAFVVGSAARGWGNKKSDIDIYVVSTAPWSGADSIGVSVPLRPPVVQWHTFYADNRGCDLAYWLDDQVDQMIAKVSWAEFDQVRASSGDALVWREEIFLERVMTCLPLFGADWVARRRAEIDASAFRSILVTRSLGQADRAVEDTLGQLEDGDLNSAVLSARIVLGHTVDALLEERGQYGSSIPKWRTRRFLAADPATLSFAQYWDLETMREFDPGDPSKWINEVLTLCQDLSLKIEV